MTKLTMLECVDGKDIIKWESVNVFTFTHLCEYYVKFFFLSSKFDGIPEVNILLFRGKELIKSFNIRKHD